MRRLYSVLQRTQVLFLFLLANYGLSLFIGRHYLDFGPSWDDPAAWLYTRLAYITTLAILYIALWLLLWPWTRLISYRVQLYILPPVLLLLFQIFLLVDVQIFGIFRYHINGLVINLLMTEGAGDSVQLGRKTWGMFLSYAVLLSLVEWILVWAAIWLIERGPQRVQTLPFLSRPPFGLSRSFFRDAELRTFLGLHKRRRLLSRRLLLEEWHCPLLSLFCLSRLFFYF